MYLGFTIAVFVYKRSPLRDYDCSLYMNAHFISRDHIVCHVDLPRGPQIKENMLH